jgi:Pyruvate/2-oxoacid:ferredoxin oxidoreductase delta subunit
MNMIMKATKPFGNEPYGSCIDKVCWWFCPDTLVSSTNKTDCHDITEILLKVALNARNI